MAIASVKAMANIIAVCILGAASGLRPMASMAFPAKIPMLKAGVSAPTAMAIAEANAFIASVSMLFIFNYNLIISEILADIWDILMPLTGGDR